MYRALYGEEFITQSINSIIDYADKVFVYCSDEVFGGHKSVMFQGKEVVFPKKFDGIAE